MQWIAKIHSKLQDFYILSHSLDAEYLENATHKNRVVITGAAILSIVIECMLIVSLLHQHPTVGTPASGVYLMFYLALIALSSLALVLQPRFQKNPRVLYWLQFSFVGGYLVWNALLNSYDLYRNERGSCLVLVMAIVFASILIQVRPLHIMTMQIFIYEIFFMANQGRITDKINSTIAVTVAVVANLLFYVQEVQSVHNRQQIAQMNAKLEKEQMEGALQYLRRLQEAQEQTAIYHHDMRHTLNLVEQLTLQGDLDKVQAFVSASQEKLGSLMPTYYCEHETVNLILGSFDQRATEKDIRLETEVCLPEEMPIADTDLCALLCNLLENALYGAEKVSDLKLRCIYIKAIVKDDKLVILVRNGFVGEVRMKNDRPVPSDKNSIHGFGTQSIISITERHQGIYVFETEGQVFRAKVMLRLR